jgi:hypothetical protein
MLSPVPVTFVVVVRVGRVSRRVLTIGGVFVCSNMQKSTSRRVLTPPPPGNQLGSWVGTSTAGGAPCDTDQWSRMCLPNTRSAALVSVTGHPWASLVGGCRCFAFFTTPSKVRQGSSMWHFAQSALRCITYPYAVLHCSPLPLAMSAISFQLLAHLRYYHFWLTTCDFTLTATTTPPRR